MINFKKIYRPGLLLIGLLTFQLTFSQENYIPGYVIKNNTDTLFGFVDYRNWESNPDRIKFKTNIENDPVIFYPTDINEFKVDKEIYVSGIVDTEVSPIHTDRLSDDPQVNIKVDTAFLQTLFKGKKSLYYYRFSLDKENFYIKQNGEFELLVYKKYLKKQLGLPVINENKKYVGQLILYLNDCETITQKLENTSYGQNSLIKLFQYYYKCSPSEIYFQKEKEKAYFEIGVLAGASVTTLKFQSDTYDYLVEAGYDPSVNFSAGLYFDLILPRNHGKWSFNNEILYSSYKVTGSYENYYSTTTTEIGYSYLKINSLIRFKYPVGQFFIFLNGGFSNGFAISETNYKKLELDYNSTGSHIEGSALTDPRKYEQGLIFGAGSRYDRFSFEIRYETGNGMSDFRNLKSSAKRYYFLLGYRF